MELKFERPGHADGTRISSNRTFMELKLGYYIKLAITGDVLIVPLWN